MLILFFGCLFLTLGLTSGFPQSKTKTGKHAAVGIDTPPVLEITYQVNGTEFQNLKALGDDEENSITVPEGASNLQIKCTSGYTMQITYEGVSDFHFFSTSRGSSSPLGPDGVPVPKHYEAVQFVQPFEFLTGNYVCSSKNNSLPQQLKSSIYIYVAGNIEFVNPRGSNIYVKDGKDIIIPCAVSDPKLSVILLKSNQDETEFTTIKNSENDPSVYSPRIGFTLDKSFLPTSIQKFHCIVYGTHSKASVVSYTVVKDEGPSTEKCTKNCESNAVCKTPSPGKGKPESQVCKCRSTLFTMDVISEACEKPCDSDNDCPENLTCRQTTEEDLFGSRENAFKKLCVNPCMSKIAAKSSTHCKVVNHAAVCED